MGDVRIGTTETYLNVFMLWSHTDAVLGLLSVLSN